MRFQHRLKPTPRVVVQFEDWRFVFGNGIAYTSGIMRLIKALVVTKMARSGSEAQRFVKQGAVWIGTGCTPECEFRRISFRCTCGGQRKATDPTEDLAAGTLLRVGDGNWRLMKPRVDGKDGFDQVPGVGRVPDADPIKPTEEAK